MIQEAIGKVIEHTDLEREEMVAVMDEIMSGKCTDAQIGAFLAALRMKGETVDEITGAATVMREKATRIDAPGDVIDTCGTGGDGLHTFNISTCAAIVACAGGAKVAKHGNRSVSSSSGSSQVLEALGVNVTLEPAQVSACIREVGMGFLFAPLLHGAMKHAIGPRKEMATRTIFNILGPLTNPAGANRQVMGVYSSNLVDPIGEVLLALGSQKAMVVHGHDGLDEISITEETSIAFVEDGDMKNMVIAPEDFGMKRGSIADLTVESPAESAERIRAILGGKAGSDRDIVLLNSAAALYVADIAADLADGVELAAKTIDNGKAAETLAKLVEVSSSQASKQ